MVPAAGLEPARTKSPTDFKSVMSTIPSRRHKPYKGNLLQRSKEAQTKIGYNNLQGGKNLFLVICLAIIHSYKNFFKVCMNFSSSTFFSTTPQPIFFKRIKVSFLSSCFLSLNRCLVKLSIFHFSRI